MYYPISSPQVVATSFWMTEVLHFWEPQMKLDELKREVQSLMSLLNDPQPGLMTWNMMMHERLVKLHRMIESAGVTSTQ
jgi:hypothetical protein